jgi:LysM repeat protein
MRNRNLIVVAVLICLGVFSTSGTTAQETGGNLLTDPGFESNAVWKNVAAAPGEGTSFNVAPAWSGWFTEQPRNTEWQNRLPNGFPHNKRFDGDPFVRGGNRAQNIGRGQATFTAAVYQTVAVPEGSNVIGSAHVVMDLNLNQNPGAQARVGIDPNGGASPFDTDIVWSNWVTNQVGSYVQASVNATATGPSVTLFLYATQSQPSDPNNVFWDDASLTIGGGGNPAQNPDASGEDPAAPAPTPVPTAPPSAPFVSPQGQQDDGSIVHTVVSGDTLAAIAVAYGTSMDEIRALNDLGDGRILQVGQRLLIREAGQAPAQVEEEPAAEAPAAETTEVDDTPDQEAPAEVTEDDAPDEAEPLRGRASGRPNTTSESSSTEDAPAAAAEVTEVVEAVEEEPVEMTEEVAAETTQAPVPDDISPTPTVEPTAVAVADAGSIDLDSRLGSVCVTLFEDLNMNRIPETGEGPLADGAIALQRDDGTDVDATVTDASPDPFCFSELEPGTYVAVGTAPEGYGLTTPNQFSVRAQPGATVNVRFGAAQGVEEVVIPPPSNTGELTEEIIDEPETALAADNPILDNLGLIAFGLAGLALIGGVGVALVLRRR